MSEFLKSKIVGFRYTNDYAEIGSTIAPLVYMWASASATPEYTPRIDSKIIAGKIYNYVYNDIAECMPTDGSLQNGDLAMVDVTVNHFRLTKYTGCNPSSYIGVVSKDPGFIVGINKSYTYPVFIALKGMVWVNTSRWIKANKALIGSEIGLYKNKVIIRKNSIFFIFKLLKYKRIGTIIDIDNNEVKIFI